MECSSNRLRQAYRCRQTQHREDVPHALLPLPFLITVFLLLLWGLALQLAQNMAPPSRGQGQERAGHWIGPAMALGLGCPDLQTHGDRPTSHLVLRNHVNELKSCVWCGACNIQHWVPCHNAYIVLVVRPSCWWGPYNQFHHLQCFQLLQAPDTFVRVVQQGFPGGIQDLEGESTPATTNHLHLPEACFCIGACNAGSI